jgi:hypothetical protein
MPLKPIENLYGMSGKENVAVIKKNLPSNLPTASNL